MKKRPTMFSQNVFFNHTKIQNFYYSHRNTPKRVTSLRCPSPRHSAKATQLLA